MSDAAAVSKHRCCMLANWEWPTAIRLPCLHQQEFLNCLQRQATIMLIYITEKNYISVPNIK